MWSLRLKRGGSGHLNYFLPAVCSRRAMTWGVKTATRSLYSASSATSVSIKSSCAFKKLGYLILLSLWLSYNLNNNNNYWGKAFIFYLHLLYHFQIFQIIVFKSSFIKTNIYNLVLYKLLSLPIFYWLFKEPAIRLLIQEMFEPAWRFITSYDSLLYDMLRSLLF